MVSDWQGWWLWADGAPPRNAFVRFRRRFRYAGGPATLHLTADTRYLLWVNGRPVGRGPVRAWPAHWRYDTYDVTIHLRPGDDNVVAVLVHHLGDGTYQSLPGPPGLLARLELAGETISGDGRWRASPEPAFAPVAPRINSQLGFEEQVDARLAEPWTQPAFDDAGWLPARPARPADDGWHCNLLPRGIPFLEEEPVGPARLLEAAVVRSLPHCWTVNLRPTLVPDDHSMNVVACHAYLVTQLWSPRATPILFSAPHRRPGPLKVNGQPVEGECAGLRAGWNSLVAQVRRIVHLPEFVLAVDGPPELRPCIGGERGGPAWAVVGPFGLGAEDERRIAAHMDDALVIAAPRTPAATCAAGEAFWRDGDVTAVLDAPYLHPVPPVHLPAANVFVQSYTDRVADETAVVEPAGAVEVDGDGLLVRPPGPGLAVRLLVDFGRTVVGFHRLEVEADAGTIIDLHAFEFIQPDGRRNLTEDVNNACRYICRDGRQAYQTYERRGFRYTYATLRDMRGPVRLRRVGAVLHAYPQRRLGDFACADPQLERIWRAGAETLRCCSEDTYTDCPAYEQAHWVGDARGQALVDWAVNGDGRLWYRCLEQAGQSLDRSPLVEAHVPSARRTLIPAWSMLWMRSCREYLLYTGDDEGARRLLPFVERNIAGLVRHLDGRGLFSIRAWNMLDWAAMDAPHRGVVTHQNCLAVLALREAAELADWLGAADAARRWRLLAWDLGAAINLHLWDEARGAYADCLRDEGLSPVVSQQTQATALLAGLASGPRGARCTAILERPPAGVVRGDSPFFAALALELACRAGRDEEVVAALGRDWGRVLDLGATTFWETWSGEMGVFPLPPGRLTRSHCHGWSATPTFVLGAHVLGVRPAAPGFRSVIIEPHPGGLAWCRGRVPTPAGPIDVEWEDDPARPFALRAAVPAGLAVRVRLPRAGEVVLNGGAASEAE